MSKPAKLGPLQRVRSNLGLDVEEAARKAELLVGYYRRVENGDAEPRLLNAADMAKALRVNLSEFARLWKAQSLWLRRQKLKKRMQLSQGIG